MLPAGICMALGKSQPVQMWLVDLSGTVSQGLYLETGFPGRAEHLPAV